MADMSERPRLICAVIVVTAFAALAGSSALASAAGHQWRSSPPINIAHQGGESDFPGNTMYAFKESLKAGADMLELDIGVTKDNQVIVQHNTTVDSRTNGVGDVRSYTLKQIRKLDNAYWFSAAHGKVASSYDHDKSTSTYKFRGIATGKKKPPKGYTADDFKIVTLRDVIAAFPHTPINVEIKGRTKAEDISEYLANARVLAALLRSSKRRDIIVVSFKQPAVDLFHTLAPKISVAPGIEGIAGFLLLKQSPGTGVVAIQAPITYLYAGAMIEVSSQAFIDQAHAAGYAWQNWFGDDDPDSAVSWKKMVDRCVDGIMSSSPIALERFLKSTKSPRTCKLSK